MNKKIVEIDELKLVHSSEVEQLRLEISDLNTWDKLIKAKNEAEVVELKAKAGALVTQIEKNTKSSLQEREWLIQEREQHDIQLAKEREASRKLIADCQDLQSDLLALRSKVTALQDANSQLQSNVIEKDTIILMKDASIERKDSELEAKNRALEEKDATLSAMGEEITKTRKYLTTKQQASPCMYSTSEYMICA